jgi:hypothetical protein
MSQGQMTLTDQIKTCRTPQEALLLLADAIDALREDINTAPPQPVDPWAQPLEWSRFPRVGDHPESAFLSPFSKAHDKTKHREQIEAVQTLLNGTTDPDEHQALQAKLRLLRDQAGEKVYENDAAGGGTIEPVPEGERPSIASDGSNGTVELTAASPERQAARAEWAVSRQLWDFIPLNEKQACDAYMKGGPMWLYLGNRDAIMAMPFAYREELVTELAKDSVVDAQEVGRDILKSTESADRDIAVHAINALSASRGL